jgi:hypothetical protein
MKTLNFEQMEQVNGGENCALAVVGFAASALGAGLSLISLNPFGVVLGVAGIYASVPSMALKCFK